MTYSIRAFLFVLGLALVALRADAQAPPAIPAADEVIRQHDGAVLRSYSWRIQVGNASASDMIPDAATTGLTNADLASVRWVQIAHCDSTDASVALYGRVGPDTDSPALSTLNSELVATAYGAAKLWAVRQRPATSTYGSVLPKIWAIAASSTVTACVTAYQ